MANNDFPVYLDLKEYFSDHRSHAKIVVKKLFKTIADLEDKISEIFGITKFYLISGDHFLPSCEPITLVEKRDTVCVKPISESSSAIVLTENYYVNQFTETDHEESTEYLWDNSATTAVSKNEYCEQTKYRVSQKKRKIHDHLFSSTPNDKMNSSYDKSDSEKLMDQISKKQDCQSSPSEQKGYIEIYDDAIKKKKTKKRKKEKFADNADDDVCEIPKKIRKKSKKIEEQLQEQIDETIGQVEKQQFTSKDEENFEDYSGNYVSENPRKRRKKSKKSHKKDLEYESQDQIDEMESYRVFEPIGVKDNMKIKISKLSKSDKNKEHSDLPTNSPETSKCKENTQSNVNIIHIDILNTSKVMPNTNDIDQIKLPPDNKEISTKQSVYTQEEPKKYERKPLRYIKARDIKSWSTEPLPRTTNLVKIIKVPIIIASPEKTSNSTIVYPQNDQTQNIEQYERKSEMNDPALSSTKISKYEISNASNSIDFEEKISKFNSETGDEISEGVNVKCKSEILISWRQKILEKTGQLEKNQPSNSNSGASSDSNEDIENKEVNSKNFQDVETPEHENIGNLNSKAQEETKEEDISKIEEFNKEVTNFNKPEEFLGPNNSFEDATDTESHTHDTSENNSQSVLAEMDECSEMKRKRRRRHKKKKNIDKTIGEVANSFHQEKMFSTSLSKPRIHIRFDDNEIDQSEPKEINENRSGDLIVENEISHNGASDIDCEALKSSQTDEQVGHEEEKTDILNFPESTNSTDPKIKKAIDEMKADLLRAFDELCVKQSPS